MKTNAFSFTLTLLFSSFFMSGLQAQIWVLDLNANITNANLGKVGIGSGVAFTPAYKLHVVGDRIRLSNNTAANAKTFDMRVDGPAIDLTANMGNLFINSLTGNTILQQSTGRVGIGTSSPGAKLHISGEENNGITGTLKITSTGGQNMLFDGNEIDAFTDGLYLNKNTNQKVVIASGGGNVGIGTTNPTYKLAVNGTIRAKEVRVESNWADYVFEPGYRLPALSEIETHIQQHRRLPGMPSALDVQENGLAVGEMQTRMMEKIEELTLYLIELKKQNDALLQRVESLEKK